MRFPVDNALLQISLKSLLTLVLSVCLGAGCAIKSAPLPYDPTLIDGTPVFGEPVEPAAPIDMLGLSEEMQTFLGPDLTGAAFDVVRFGRLMSKMKRAGFFEDRYDGNATYTAAKTFATRRGNCLGYTNLFIALARGVGLDAKFQLVENRPKWEVEGDYLVRNNHINVLIDSVSIPGRSATTIEVDFNNIQQGVRDRATSRVISDAYATSLFYANLAMDDFHQGNHQLAFSMLKRAILTAPENKGLWSNLGVLYLALDKPIMAEQAYAQALDIDDMDKTAMTGMVVALRTQERMDEAELLAKRLKRYQAKRQRRAAAESLQTAFAVDS